MINALRTFLLNISGTNNPSVSYPGEEYVPADYKARSLTPPLRTAWRNVFGAVPDRAMLNYRLRELLAIIHSTELKDFAYDLDSRVTYWPGSDTFYTLTTTPPTITPLGATTAGLYVQANPPVISNSEQLNFQWQIDVLDGSNVQVRKLAAPTPLPPPSSYAYTLTSGLSDQIQLDGSDKTFRFQTGVGSSWQVGWIANPARTLVDVMDAVDRMAGTVSADVLFSDAEPYRTFRNLWLYHPHQPYRTAGFVLALGYRISEL